MSKQNEPVDLFDVLESYLHQDGFISTEMSRYFLVQLDKARTNGVKAREPELPKIMDHPYLGICGKQRLPTSNLQIENKTSGIICYALRDESLSDIDLIKAHNRNMEYLKLGGSDNE